MKNKNYREVVAALKAKGITLTGAEASTGNRTLLHVERKGVRAKFYCGINHVAGHHLLNLVKSARDSLRARGAVFTEAELADGEMTPAPVKAPLPSREKKPRHPTKLNRKEKADFYALVKSGTDFLEACKAYTIHVTTGDSILTDGDKGVFNEFLAPEYRPNAVQAPRDVPVGTATVKPTIEVPREAYTDEPTPAPTPTPMAFTFAPDEIVRPKVNPLDPRLLALAAEVGLLQERLSALRANAAELGITVVAELKVDWA